MQENIDRLIAVLRAAMRFRWQALIVTAVVLVGSLAWIEQLDYRYSAKARIFVDGNQILKPLLRDIAVQPDVGQRIQLMSRTLLNRPNLERLVRMADLDISASTPYEKERLLTRLERDIKLRGTRGNSSLYTILYSHPDPDVARRIVQSLITVFIESSLGQEREDSQSAQDFLDEQIADYEVRLAASERRLAEFKRENSGKMPGEAGGYYQRLETAERQLRAARLELREAVNRRTALERQLSGESSVIAGQTNAPVLSDLELRLQSQRRELDALLLRYTDRHPQVTQLRDSLTALEARQLEVEADGSSRETAARNYVASPAYQEIRALASEADARVAELEVRVEEFELQKNALEDTVESIPEVEAQLRQLDRDYTIVKQQFETLLKRREAARMSEQVETQTDDIKFRVIDPPFVPTRPSSPDKVKLSLGALAASVLAGIVVAVLLSLIRPGFYDVHAIEAVTGRGVIGTVALKRSRGGSIARFVERFLWFAAAGIVLLVFGLAFAWHKNILDLELLEQVRSSSLGPALDFLGSRFNELGTLLREQLESWRR